MADKVKAALSKELESVIKEAISSSSSSSEKEGVASDIVQGICNVIEAIFIHGLRDPFFLKGSRYAKYPEPNFWPFVSKFSHPSITTHIRSLSMINTEIGKSRAWIRLVLNEGSTEHYVKLLLAERRALEQFYKEEAYLRDSEQADRMSGVIRSLSKIVIKTAVNSSLLNTWTPSPLILAGLVSGKPQKVITGSSRSYRQPRPPANVYDATPEVGLSALDTLPDPSLPPLVKRRLCAVERRTVNTGDESGSETSSVYSHPSMTERRSLPFSPSPTIPIGSNPNDFPPLDLSPIVVTRRTSTSDSHSRASSLSESQRSSSIIKTDKEEEKVVSKENREDELLKTKEEKKIENSDEPEKNDEPSTSEVASESDRIEVPEFEYKLEETEEKPTETIEPQASLEVQDSEVFHDEIDVSIEENPHIPESSKVQEVQKISKTEQQNEKRSTHFEIGKTGTEEEDSKLEKSTAEEGRSLEILQKETGIDEQKEEKIEPEPEKLELGKAERCPTTPILIRDRDMSHSTFTSSSLQDELMASGESLAAGSNSLLAMSAIRRKNSESRRTSTSSSTSSPSYLGVVSFGQALRSAYNECQIAQGEESTEATSSESEHQTEEKVGERREVEVLIRLCKLPQEKGLDAQEFRCPMCRKSIGMNFGKYEQCGMDAQYYCSECMKGGDGVIPARVLLNWDWAPRKLSNRGRTFIDANQEKAVIDIAKINPQLYKRIPMMANALRLREKLRLISMYLFTCRESIAEDFKKRIWPKSYFYEQEHTYSFSDLIALHNGHLESHLNGLLKHATSHVMSCALCRQKGFYCEICHKKELLYPFQDNIYRCQTCCSVFHSECMRQVFDCPRCTRKRSYETAAPTPTAHELDSRQVPLTLEM